MGVYRYDRDTDNDGLHDEAGATAMVVVVERYDGRTIRGDERRRRHRSRSRARQESRCGDPSTGLVNVLPGAPPVAGETKLNASGNVMALNTVDSFDPGDANSSYDTYRVELSGGPPVSLNVGISAPLTTPPGATDVAIANISPSIIRGADFDVSAAPGGGVKRSPGGGVKRSPGGGVKRSPGGGVKRSDELSRYVAAFSRVPAINNLPLSAIPIDGGWESRLPVSLQGRPLQSLTFGQVLTAIGPATVQLEQLDLANTPLVNLSSASLALGTAPLNSLLMSSTTSWCTRLTQLTTRTCIGGASPLGGFTTQTTLLELEMRADTQQLLSDHPELSRIPIRINLATMRTAGSPVLQETFSTLGLGVSKVGDLPVATAIAATPGIGDLTVGAIGNPALVLDCQVAACPAGALLSSMQTSGQVQARARLRDFTTAITGKTLDDVAAVLPADITINDVLIGLLEAQDFPWEAVDLVTSGIQEAATAPATVAYTVSVAATGGTGPFDATVEVILPAGWRFVPGSAALAPLVALPLTEPTRTYSQTETTLGFRLVGFMPGVSHSITFQVIPGFQLGTVAARASAESAGVVGSAAPAAITVVEPADAASDPDTANVLQSDHLYFSYTTTDADTDLFRFNPPAGKVVSVWLSNFDRDADLSLYGPALDAAGAAGSPSSAVTRAAAPATAPLADEGTTSVAGALIAEPQSERDVPLVGGTTLLASSANSDVDVEGASAVNANLIQVSPYRGATSTNPYVLRVRLDDTDVAAACTYTRTGGVPGPGFDVNTLPADLETAILVHQERLGDAMTAPQAQDLIDTWLAQLTTAGGVNGAIVHLDQVTNFSALDANWCSPDASNDVVRQVGTVIEQIRAARPSLRHIVIVGGDDVIPMARIDDVTRTGNRARVRRRDPGRQRRADHTADRGTRHTALLDRRSLR